MSIEAVRELKRDCPHPAYMDFLKWIMRAFFEPDEIAPHWEAVKDANSPMWRVRWSAPNGDGLFFYVRHYSGPVAEHMAQRNAAEWNKAGRHPAEFVLWVESKRVASK